jgi:hypothetical protein
LEGINAKRTLDLGSAEANYLERAKEVTAI